ncbi:hypothetical protein EPUS_09494 [Endocarpon pusillum Z07020]|uniref:Uncharacterized protein n=1 Tax=Endocarpon pusillum (strain Z07020 / HMAS-L-300199) TaxID=1263415 RepID=U1GSC4_ENDPU|nr:uncharacterized protein EPUS_09494 [Endocarpon pusillum Z07020]ERF74896.1 hypothetical protein EPUS_09494 [Endocarpon pusillum Z07020]
MGPSASKDRPLRGPAALELPMGGRRAQSAPQPGADRPDQRGHSLFLLNLPDELQEQIIFHSLEPCLARALANSSISRARQISDVQLYKVFILHAFFDNEPPLPVRQSHFAPATYRFLARDQRRRLQRDIVECKWFTWDLFQKHIPTLAHLALERQCRLHHQAEQRRGNDISSLPDIDNLADLIELYIDHPQPKQRRETGLTDERGSYHPYLNIIRRDLEPEMHILRPVIFLAIPSRALNPISWTEEARHYLWVVAARVELGSEYDAAAFKRGLKKATSEQKSHIVATLLNIQAIASGQEQDQQVVQGRTLWQRFLYRQVAGLGGAPWG